MITRRAQDKEAEEDKRHKDQVFLHSVASNLPELYEELYGVETATPEEEDQIEFVVPETDEDFDQIADMLKGMPGFPGA